MRVSSSSPSSKRDSSARRFTSSRVNAMALILCYARPHMQPTMPLRRWLAAGLVPMVLGLPLPSAAATPSAQTMLNMALIKEWTGQPTRQDTTIKMTVAQTAYKKTDPSGSASLSLHLKTRTVPVSGSQMPDQEGSLSLDSLSMDPGLTDG